MAKKSKKYAVIIKADSEKFLKYRGVAPKDFKNLYLYLDRTYPNWRWGNVYYYRNQIGSFTKTNRPDRF